MIIDTEKYYTHAQHSICYRHANTQAFSFQLKLGSLTVLICGEKGREEVEGGIQRWSQKVQRERSETNLFWKIHSRFNFKSGCVTDVITLSSAMIYHGYGLSQDKLLTCASKSQT